MPNSVSQDRITTAADNLKYLEHTVEEIHCTLLGPTSSSCKISPRVLVAKCYQRGGYTNATVNWVIPTQLILKPDIVFHI